MLITSRKEELINKENNKQEELMKNKNCKRKYDDDLLRKLALMWVNDVISEKKKENQ
jgi:hypothetical protein